MTERPRYSMDEELEAAEEAARELHGQIARLRKRVKEAKTVLGAPTTQNEELERRDNNPA